MSVKSTSFHKELWRKPFTSQAKQIKRNLRYRFVDERQLKTIMPKSPNISCAFLLFKVSAFLQILFPRKSKIWERRFFSVVNVWHSFTHWSIYFFNWTKKHWLKTSTEESSVGSEAVVQRCSIKKVFLEISQNPQKNNCARDSFLIKLHTLACNFIKKESMAQGFSCEFCEISKNTSGGCFWRLHDEKKKNQNKC